MENEETSSSSNSSAARYQQQQQPPPPHMDDDDEEECRVCRESHGVLFRPCKCAGSIRYTHQECLLQWLNHSGKDSCELCKHKFHFQPVYAEDAPAHIPTGQVLARCLRKAICEYLPFVARLVMAAVLWLGVVPCTTSWIYRIWIHRASLLVPDLVRRRVHGGGGAMLWNDAVSGMIIASFIIFSFLSLMSFADFLRFHWDIRDGPDGGEGPEEDVGQPGGGGGADNNNNLNNNVDAAAAAVGGAPLPPLVGGNANQGGVVADAPAGAGAAQPQGPPPPQVAPRVVFANNINNNNNNNNNFNGNNDGGANAGGADGDLDVELHVAVDELMGIRGPFVYLVRNILWLVAFNGAYLGLFAFIPYSVGAAVVEAAEKYVETPLGLCTLRFLVPRSICALAAEISQAAAKDEHTLQLPDLGIILLGYLLMSAMVFTWRTIVSAVCQRVAVTALPMLGKVVRVLECTAAIVKVGVLLFSKMALCPLLLGLWLDAATARVVGPDHAARVLFATENLVGALLLHWVAGITFMLFVTVSVLQLREVLHPDLLARSIRPQEPQPDLLGSLLQESGLTHARRMAISLGIYVLLLLLFIYLPAELLGLAGINAATQGPLRLRTFYLAPQLQIPLELILFHLAMLAFLEHTKSTIGRLQYLWLRPWCQALGLTRFLLPLTRLPPSWEPATAAAAAAAAAGGGADGVDAQQQQQQQDQQDEQQAQVPEVPEVEYLLGPPVQRPPMEWDEDGGYDDTRWAWGNEPVSEVERSVAPRARPPLCGLRLVILLVASWAGILLLVGSFLLLPLLLGRAGFALLRISDKFYHDPFAFALGVGICWTAHKFLTRLQRRLTLADVRAWAAQVSWPSSTRAAVVGGVFVFLWWGLAPLLLGLLFDLALVLPEKTWGEEGLGGLRLGADWLVGIVFLHQWAYLAAAGMVDGAWFPRVGGEVPGAAAAGAPGGGAAAGGAAVAGGGEGGNVNQAAVAATVEALKAVFFRWDWERATYTNLVKPFVWPLTTQLLELVAVPANAAFGLAYLRDRAPDLLSLAALPAPDAIPTAELQILCFRMTVLAWVLAMLSLKCMGPLHRWLASIQAAVRDEKYLVRLELVNHT